MQMQAEYVIDYAELAGTPQARSTAEELRDVQAYLPLVKRVVRQLNSQAGGAVDRDDMEQIGLMGLLEALRRYGQPDAGFGSYAAMRIRGAILDELRRQDWRPRAVRQQSHRIRDAVRELRRRLGREPTEAEVIKGLGITAEAWKEYLLDENAEVMGSFDDLIQEFGEVPEKASSPEEQLIMRRSLEQALGQLDEREQRVVQMYYEFELSYKEIAAVLDLTDARVCQLNKGALKKMKSFLQGSLGNK